MALYKYQVVIHRESNLAEDDCVNVLYFDTNEPDDIMGDIANGYISVGPAVSGMWAGDINGLTIKAYQGVVGEPEFVQDFAWNPSGASGPAEVALCLSYGADDAQDDTSPRRRGRIYLGPLGANTLPRPTTDDMNSVLDLGEYFASIGLATGTTWHMYSPTNAQSYKIEHIAVDNAWDTQRRRGYRPTERLTRDVQ